MNSLEEEICMIIAVKSPYSIHQVRFAYKVYKSFDALIAVVDLSAKRGLSYIILLPQKVIDYLRVESNTKPEV